MRADTSIWLVRHGETEWSRDGRHTGKTDIPLTPAGRKQAEALRGVLSGVDPALVLCSPRLRARDTAELAGLHVDAIDDDLGEWEYGDYEGRTSKDIHSEDPGWTVFADDAPGGETAEQVTLRADRVLARAVEAAESADGRPIVLIGHGHMSRVLGVRWIGLSAREGARVTLGTAATCHLGVDHDLPVIVRWNIENPAG